MRNPVNKPLLILAPMEGVTDWVMRDLLTAIGSIDQCVTEFLRITNRLHPYSVFEKICPELKTNSRTRAGTTVFVQLLGSDAIALAENAGRAAEMGALGIDLNFGCPAKTVNRHDGGATLLKSSERLFKIITQVRATVPNNIPVTAKIRLGFDNPAACLENAMAIEAAGANWITVHCRTKTDGYKPPAFWEWIPKIQDVTKIPLITNGEIWNTEDFLKCTAVAKTFGYMMGRGAIRDPFLFKKISALPSENSTHAKLILSPLIINFFDSSKVYVNGHFAVARTKGWLKQLSFVQPQIKEMFEKIKVIKKPEEFRTYLESYFLK